MRQHRSEKVRNMKRKSKKTTDTFRWHWDWNIRTRSWGLFDREYCEGDYRWSR